MRDRANAYRYLAEIRNAHYVVACCLQITGSAIEAGGVLSTCVGGAIGAIKGGWFGVASEFCGHGHQCRPLVVGPAVLDRWESALPAQLPNVQ